MRLPCPFYINKLLKGNLFLQGQICVTAPRIPASASTVLAKQKGTTHFRPYPVDLRML